MQKSGIDKPYLSVAIITFNEERIIEKTLSAIHNWVDEIVVVDSYCTDNTKNLLEIFNVVLYQEKWRGYSQQRSFAISKCRGKWILMLDADEVVTNPLVAEIKEVIKRNSGFDGYKIKRRFYIGNRWIRYGGYYPDYQLRLFKNNGKAYINDREVHESISLEGQIGYLKNPIEHYAYENIEEYSKALDKYAILASKEIKKKKVYMPFIRALWAFFYRYICRLGFLEGKTGFDLVLAYSKYVFNKYKLAAKNKNKLLMF